MFIKFLTSLLLVAFCVSAWGQSTKVGEPEEFAVDFFLESLWSRIDLKEVPVDSCVRLTAWEINSPVGQCILVRLNGALRVITPRLSDTGEDAKLTVRSKSLDAKRSAAFERIWDNAFKIRSDFDKVSWLDGRFVRVEVLENGKVRSHRLEMDAVVRDKPADDPMRVLVDLLLENLEFIAPYGK